MNSSVVPYDMVLEISKYTSDLRFANKALYQLWLNKFDFNLRNITKSYCILKLRTDSISICAARSMETQFPYLTLHSLDRLILQIDEIEFTFPKMDLRLARRYQQLVGQHKLPLLKLYDSIRWVPKLLSYRKFHFLVQLSVCGALICVLRYIK